MENENYNNKIGVKVEAGTKDVQSVKGNGFNHYLVTSLQAPGLPDGDTLRNPIDLVAAIDFSTSYI